MAPRLPSFWHELSSPAFARLDPERTVAVLPVGAIEQHGPHLPVAVDTCLLDAIVGRALERMPDGTPVLVLPTSAVGKSNEHLAFPGTLTLSAATLGRVWYEIGASVRRAGVRKLLFLNGHGGQPQVMEMAARELRLRHGDYVVLPHFTWRVPHAAGRFLAEREKRLAMHAGHAETAILMALAPETVHMERAVTNYPPEFGCPTLSADGRAAAAWTARDFGPSGIIGDPLPATLEQGRVILESLADSWARGIGELHALKWVERSAPTWGRSHWIGDVTPR